MDLTKLESAETYSLLGQAIISTADNAYSRFWQNLHAMDWVNTGHTHYSENAEGCCPYCKRELPSDFEEQFLACFDEKYSQDCARLGEFGRKYAEYMTATFIEPLRRYIELIPQTGFGDWKAYGEQLKLIENTVQMNNQKIAAKIEKPSEVVGLNSIREYVERVNELLAETNKMFEANNKIFDAKAKPATIVSMKRGSCWPSKRAEIELRMTLRIKSYSTSQPSKSSAIKKLNSSLGVLKNEIRELSDKMGGTGVHG
jgi:wobble nucleotide-excising tRNase